MKRYAAILKTVVLLAAAPLAIYGLSVSKTFKVIREYRGLEAGGVFTAPDIVRTGTFQEAEPLLGTGAILGVIMPACSAAGASVVSYSPKMSDSAAGLELWMAELVLSGRFRQLLAVTDSLSHISQIKTVDADFMCDERMRNDGIIRLRLNLVQLEQLSERQSKTQR